MTKSFYTLIIISLSLLLISCAKKPEAPLHPAVIITIEQDIFLVNFTCSVLNENENIAFTNLDGVVNIKDNAGSILLEIPFNIPVILPFAAASINETLELSEDAVTPVLTLLNIDKEKLKLSENIGKKYLDEKNIEFKDLNLEKKDIIELLRGKI
ncbi:MAG: hypothetical protein FWF73_02560 [Spirochaetes bacterium]|nr:hypothetical protein [Spirochaetota bacterium]